MNKKEAYFSLRYLCQRGVFNGYLVSRISIVPYERTSCQPFWLVLIEEGERCYAKRVRDDHQRENNAGPRK